MTFKISSSGYSLLLYISVVSHVCTQWSGGSILDEDENSFVTVAVDNTSTPDACGSNPCLRGTCFTERTDYRCFCPSGFTGKNCDSVLDACISNPCVRGTCLHSLSQYYCECPSGYTGKNCESPTNACNSDPCVRGVCYHHQSQFHCVCPPGYYGKRCEINNNECISQPCLNGGRCIDDVGNFSCSCAPGFNGSRCEIDIDECSPNPCLNGGVCVDGINHFACHCKTGYSGDSCQNVTDPCTNSPCVRGTCFSHMSLFFCECPTGYTGKLCVDKVSLTLIGPREEYLTLPTGNSLTLNCSVSPLSSSYVSFAWSKVRKCDLVQNYDQYHYNNGYGGKATFEQKDVTIGDAGTYICTAKYRSTLEKVQKIFRVDITWQSEICYFDGQTTCGWQKGSFWRFQSGRNSPSSGIEKYNDHTIGTESGIYLQVVKEAANVEKIADITSHNLPANHTVCLEFWYRVSGTGIGTLSILLQDTCLKKHTELRKFSGDHGRKWNKATTTIPKHYIPNDYYVIIQATLNASFYGDMAVDDLLLSKGSCQGDQGISIVG